MSTSPGTSTNQASHSAFTAGKHSTVSAPGTIISRRTDQIHWPVRLSVLLRALPTRTLLFSVPSRAARDGRGRKRGSRGLPGSVHYDVDAAFG